MDVHSHTSRFFQTCNGARLQQSADTIHPSPIQLEIHLSYLLERVIMVVIAMPAKRRSRAKPFKLKLKKKTIYTIFGVGFMLAGIFLLLTFVKHSGAALAISDLLTGQFG